MKTQNRIIIFLTSVFFAYILIFSGVIYYSISSYAYTYFYKRLEIRAITMAKIQLENNQDIDVVKEIHELGKLPVVNFAAGGIATPADAALMMQLGCDGVFVGSGIFKSGDPKERAEAIVIATTNYNDPEKLIEVSKNLGEPMVGINIDDLDEAEKLAKRGW